MLQWFEQLLFPDRYMPHGHCYLWQSNLVWLHVLSDGAIALAYYSIPLMLLYFIRKREDAPFRYMFVLFGAFIITCGSTHLLEIWTLWYPAYWLSGSVKMVTALVSCYTALELLPLLPQALALPSPAQLKAINQELKTQIAEREQAEAEVHQLNQVLEERVRERTAALEAANHQLESEIAERKHAEVRLRLLERAIAASSNGVFITDASHPENPIVYVNPGFEKITGYEATEIMGRNPHFLQESAVHQLALEDVRSALREGKSCHVTLHDYRRDGTPFWSELSISPLRNEAGLLTHYVGIQTDITELKETQEALQQTNEQLTQWVRKLRRVNREMTLIEGTSNFLQACTDLEEAKTALPELLAPLFPGLSGGIFLASTSRRSLTAIATWGEAFQSKLTFPIQDCWALRRGRIHRATVAHPGLFCHHMCAAHPEESLCIPTIARGEMLLGLLQLHATQPGQIDEATQQLARIVAEQVALGIANLQLREKLRNESIRDSLTTLFNRRYLEESLDREIERCHRSQNPLCVIMLDIDRFKLFNDTWGHEAGDVVLAEVGRYLRQSVRSSDIACRYGGEELTLILPEVSLKDATVRAEELRQGIRALRLTHGDRPLNTVTVSLGIACFPDHGLTKETLLRAADEALYRAKAEGRDRVVGYAKNSQG